MWDTCVQVKVICLRGERRVDKNGKERYRGRWSDGKVELRSQKRQRAKGKVTLAGLLTGGPGGRYDRQADSGKPTFPQRSPALPSAPAGDCQCKDSLQGWADRSPSEKPYNSLQPYDNHLTLSVVCQWEWRLTRQRRDDKQYKSRHGFVNAPKWKTARNWRRQEWISE